MRRLATPIMYACYDLLFDFQRMLDVHPDFPRL